MTASRPMGALGKLGSLLLPNARERLRALLPELLLSIIAMTCMSVVMSYHDGSSVAMLVIVAGLTQVFVQGTLYACTYLIRDERGVNAAWLILPAGIMASEAILGFTGLANLDSALVFASPLSILLGTMLFYIIRLRWTLVLFVTELLVLVDSIDEIVVIEPSMLFVHIACICAIAALLLMRSSATRITMPDGWERAATKPATNEGRPSRTLGIYGQVAALSVAVGLVCLMVAFAGTPAVWRRPATGESGTNVSVETDPTADTGSTVEETPEGPVGDVLMDDDLADTQSAGDAMAPDSSGPAVGGPPLIPVLLALLALPVPLRLLARRVARLSLERERQPTDRATKIYLRALSRLDAVGIVRDEAMTPREFLSAQEDRLVELTAPAGVGLDEWAALTDVYEKARYAGLDPTEDELRTCWRVYDALPACARRTLGWCRYLAGAFWRM